MNQELMMRQYSTGKVTFFSRTKNRFVDEGESSGNTLQVVSITADCDNDTLLIKAIQPDRFVIRERILVSARET